MKKLNKSQQKILDYLRERSQDGVPPSVREICAATGLKSTSTVHAHLKALEENGFISRDAGLNRAIHISGVERSVQVPVLGDIVVALLEDEATVKRFFREDGHIRLQPENPAFQPIISEQVVILGRVVSLIRNYN